ncbi:hypothetical protein GCM10009734_66670 [Nonomuraea bangladeshensis]
MALWVCLGCSTRFAVGVEACPHCGGTEHEEEGMPKITRLGGASVAPVHLPKEEPSPGNSSETSSEKQQTSEQPAKQPRPRRAPTTGSRSSKGRKGSSTARSTDGSGAAE